MTVTNEELEVACRATYGPMDRMPGEKRQYARKFLEAVDAYRARPT
jgi:hypothetical protein